MENEGKQYVNPWVMGEEMGFWRTLFTTIWDIIFFPRRFFRSLADYHPIHAAFAFYIISSLAQVGIIGMFFVALKPQVISGIGKLVSSSSLFVIIAIALIVFIGMAIYISVGALIVHIFALILGGKGGYSGTFSVLAYGSSSEILCALLLPILNTASYFNKGVVVGAALVYLFFAVIWICVIHIIGYREVHKIGVVRAVLIFILPVILVGLLQFGMKGEHFRARVKNIIARMKTKARPVLTQASKDTPIAALSSPIEWRSDLTSALAEAGNRSVLVMADFYTDWCGWCKKLDSQTYEDKEVAELSRQFVCVKIDGDKERGLVAKYNVRGYPAVIFMDSAGKEEKRISGYMDPRGFANTMKELLEKNKTASPPAAKPDQEKPKPVVKEERFRMEGVVFGSDGYKAVINGDFVKVGDTIDGANVVEITQNRVTLSDKDGEEIVLRS